MGKYTENGQLLHMKTLQVTRHYCAYDYICIYRSSWASKARIQHSWAPDMHKQCATLLWSLHAFMIGRFRCVMVAFWVGG